ncbi:hypothetical protein IFM89_039953 [Coptis chinensis]|uniref:Uncharacterized protein n=1 Tax=Coptis chinensis TaxID=261450 RepID=A0A835LA67_9MAGN|nr:hypothetical protein IFM89_039953 [Coptis chinensis]
MGKNHKVLAFVLVYIGPMQALAQGRLWTILKSLSPQTAVEISSVIREVFERTYSFIIGDDVYGRISDEKGEGGGCVVCGPVVVQSVDWWCVVCGPVVCSVWTGGGAVCGLVVDNVSFRYCGD